MSTKEHNREISKSIIHQISGRGERNRERIKIKFQGIVNRIIYMKKYMIGDIQDKFRQEVMDLSNPTDSDVL